MNSISCVQSTIRDWLRSIVRPIGFARWAAVAAILLVGNNGFSAERSRAGLLQMPPGRPLFLNRPYERLCQEKLFVTPGEVARYFFVPAFRDSETLVSIHRSRQLPGNFPGNYWVTVTRPTRRLGRLFTDPDARLSEAEAIKVERRDAPIPASTAQAIHRVWLAMLQGARPRTRLDMKLDSDSMFFFATEAAGKTLRAEYHDPSDEAFALGQIGQSLIGYGYAPVRKRVALAREIEAKASALYQRVR